MAEKRGETVKLIYDFNTAGHLEVYMNDKWYRATGREFRSFDGPRRITEPAEIKLGTVDVPMRTYDYWGPVYMFGTNKEMTYTNSGSMYTGKVWDANRKISESRG